MTSKRLHMMTFQSVLFEYTTICPLFKWWPAKTKTVERERDCLWFMIFINLCRCVPLWACFAAPLFVLSIHICRLHCLFYRYLSGSSYINVCEALPQCWQPQWHIRWMQDLWLELSGPRVTVCGVRELRNQATTGNAGSCTGMLQPQHITT